MVPRKRGRIRYSCWSIIPSSWIPRGWHSFFV